ncbi:hypothetical protein [Streptomyces bauhiniae]
MPQDPQVDILYIMAMRPISSMPLVVGGDFALKWHGLRPDNVARINIYYAPGFEPSAENKELVTRNLKTLKGRPKVAFREQPDLASVTSLHDGKMPQHVTIPSYEDSVRITLERMADRRLQDKKSDTGLPLPNDYLNLYRMREQVGLHNMDALLAMNAHSVDLQNFRLNLERLNHPAFLAAEFAGFQAEMPGNPNIRAALLDLRVHDFAITRSTLNYARAITPAEPDYDEVLGRSTALESVIQGAAAGRYISSSALLPTPAELFYPDTREYSEMSSIAGTPSPRALRTASMAVWDKLRDCLKFDPPVPPYSPSAAVMMTDSSPMYSTSRAARQGVPGSSGTGEGSSEEYFNQNKAALMPQRNIQTNFPGPSR